MQANIFSRYYYINIVAICVLIYKMIKNISVLFQEILFTAIVPYELYVVELCVGFFFY